MTQDTIDPATASPSQHSRRTFLKTVAAGSAGGLALSAVGTPAAGGIPTPRLERSGSDIVDPSGNEVVLRGVNIADPRRINSTAGARGKTTEQVIDFATDESAGWYSRVIRLPIHPGDIAGLPPIPQADVQVHQPITFSESELIDYCENHLDPAVERCKQNGAYAIVDYHRHWGAGALPWDDPTLSKEVQMFWDIVAPRYASEDHVIYEMYNEPTSPNMGGTPLVNGWSRGRWDHWVETCQPWIDTIRKHSDALTLVGSPMWSQYPEGGVVREPDGGNLAYTYHIYPGHSISDTGDWDGVVEGGKDTNGDGVVDTGQDQSNGEGVYEAYKAVPLFATEFGWQTGIGAYPTIGTTSDFGEPYIDWLEANNISWTAWCFDPVWLSAMFERDFPTGDSQDAIGDPYSGSIPTYCENLPCDWVPLSGENMGAYVKNALAEKSDDMIPGGETDTPTATTSTTTATPTETTTTSPDGPSWPTDPRATDPDGDGLYEDISGDGTVNFPDVNMLFQNSDTANVRDNARFYDFEPNGQIDLQDVMALFQMV
ncbi:MAG: glycoside hydrolase family 5 protein [Halococcoides sp.]